MGRTKKIQADFPTIPPSGKTGGDYLRWLESQNSLHLLALNAIHDAVLFMDPQGLMTYVNQAAEKLLGRNKRDLGGTNLLKFIRTVEGEQLGDEIIDRVKVLSEFICSLAYIRHADGTLIPVELRVSSLEIQGVTVRIMATCHDLRESLEHQRELETQAQTDQLTGCKNRRWFDNEYPKYETWARNTRGWLSLVFIDLDHFKRFNDESYILGDELIQLAAATIRTVLRPEDPLVRLGGDEFVLPMQAIDLKKTVVIAERILSAMAALDIRMPRRPEECFRLTASIGLSVMQGSDQRIGNLLLYAQEAKRLAKEGGRNRICVLPEQTDADSERPSLH